MKHETSGKRHPTFDARFSHLLDAAAEVFSAEGYDRASMRRIAAEARLSLAGIYHYVAGKEELLYWIQFRAFDSLLRGMERSLEGKSDPRERLATAVHNHVRHFGTKMHELKVCAQELDTLEGEAYQEVHNRRRAYFEAFHALVKALPTRGEEPIDSWLATANLFGMLNWFYQWYDPERSPIGLDDLARQQSALFLNGYADSDSSNNHRGDP